MGFFHDIHDPFYQTLALIGLFILLFGLVSLFVKERLYLTESLVAILFGILFGPHCIPVIDPVTWFSEETYYRMLMEFARIIISFQVMAVGLCTPFDYLKKEWISIAMLLGPTMVFMWCVSSLSVFLIMGYGWWESMMIGACLAPTDPVLANAVIKGKFANRYIPGHLRNLLSVESGANDGLGFPFLMLPIYMTMYPTDIGEAMKEWVVHTWLYEIFFSIVVGFVLGWIAKKLLEKSEEYRLIDKESFLVYAIALAMSISGLVALISSDDLLSVFIAGNVFAYDDKFHQATKDAHFQGILDMLFNITFFVFLGASFPWNTYYSMGVGHLIMTSVAILLLRRLPFVMVMRRFIPQIRSNKEAFFCGWFGPMGVGAIFFAMVCYQNPELDHSVKATVFNVVTFVVLSSIVIHGITVPITYISLKTKAKRKLKRQLQKDSTALEGSILPSGAEYSPNDYQEEETETETSPVAPSDLTFEPSPLDPSIANAYVDDPYAETLDLRGLPPEQVYAKLYGGTASQPPPEDKVIIPIQRIDTYGSNTSAET